MTILIKGMEMPKEGTVIAIYKLNGQFFASVHGTELSPLTEVPTPHGRLIDADALNHEYYKSPSYLNLCNAINVAPTIIEAEVEE